jgi:phosphomannomutase / phosphoglucomutase
VKFFLALRNLIKTPVVLLGIVVLVSYAVFISQKLYQAQVVEPWNQNTINHVDVTAHMLATQLSDYLIKLEKDLKKIAQQEDIIFALQAENDAHIEEAQKNLLKKWPLMEDALLLRDTEDYAANAENFVATDLLRQSNAGVYPPPVAVKPGTVWIIYISTPVLIDKNRKTIGSLLVSYPADIFKIPIEQNHRDAGHIEIRQTTRGFAPQAIFSIGERSTALNKTVPVATITDWELSYTAASSSLSSIPKPMAYFYFSLTGIILLTLVLIGLLVRYSVRLTENIGTLFTTTSISSTDLPPEELNKLVAEKLSSIKKVPPASELENSANLINSSQYPAEVFRDYDIRGQAKTQITTDFAEALGKTLGTMDAASKQALAVAADGRITSPELKEALIKGILTTGSNVIDLGFVPTPVFNFGIQNMANLSSGIIVTASHNPAEDNGFKIIIDENVMSADEIALLGETMHSANWHEGSGQCNKQDVVEDYCTAIKEDIVVTRPIHVIVDCANGVMGSIAPRLLDALGCQVTPLYCDVDGTFPNHAPDPSDPDNLKDLVAIMAYENADLGLAFDGDGDRVVAVSASGRIVWPDELMMIFSRDLLARQPGSDIVFDVKSTRRLRDLISSYGGRPVMCKTGHSNIRRKIKETDAPLGGEYSGHIFFKDRWFGFDDGLYAAARLIEIMDIREQNLDEMMDSFESTAATPEIKVPVPDDQKFEIMEKIIQTASFEESTFNTLDGLRVEFTNGWGLVRASNTSASLTLRFEADNDEALKTIQDYFSEQISDIIPDIALPF